MRISLAALAVFAATALSACGSSGGGATTAGSRTAAATSARSATATGATSTSPGPTAATSSTTTATTTTAGTAGAASVGGPGTPCVAAGLVLSFLGGQGATGHGELGFALRNTGAACSTGGYPGIQFLDQAGAPLPTTPSHTTSDFFGQLPLRELTLAPGQSVSFRLGVSHGDGSSAGCSTAYGLQVIAPNDTATLRVKIPNGASECGTTTVSPVEPGDSAYQ
jgi:hypothetical protein